MTNLTVGGVIYNHNAEPVVITGETSRSWLIGSGWNTSKISKVAMRLKGNDGEYRPMYFASDEAAADVKFAYDHAYHIARYVESLRHEPERCAKLRQIATIVGYVPK